MANKNGNQKIILDGITFDCITKRKYYEQLKWMKSNKQIKSFKVMPRYLLQDSFTKNGIHFKKIEYIADFEIHRLDGSTEVIDIKKAQPTAEFKLKHKLFEHKYLQSLKILFYKPEYGGFIEWEDLKKIEKRKAKVRGNAKAKKPHMDPPVSKRGRAKRLSL